MITNDRINLDSFLAGVTLGFAFGIIFVAIVCVLI